eukprot:TRINITY_DN265_c0_g1_i1.p2 TRINITY_DN265_c0_g1~~TRINITY_DN265_c0_g1_i1.p2  ORF type:complete len:700 (+),score=132.39 TRINITY_DN265_c0_g1_i1:6628-8727(+)
MKPKGWQILREHSRLVAWKAFFPKNYSISIFVGANNKTRPKDQFASPGKSKTIRDIRYEKFEQKRKELMTIVRNARNKLLEQINHTAEGSLSRMSRHQSAPDLKGASQFSSVKSKMLFENIVSDTHRGNYDKIVQKAKQREIHLMNKMLKNEEMKNNRYEQQEVQKEAAERRIAMLEKKRQWEFKKNQEEKIRQEFERIELMKREEQRLRQEALERMRAEMDRQKAEEERRIKLEKERQREMEEKEQIRKEKAAKAAEMREQELAQQAIKLDIMARKLQERERLIKLKRDELKRKASQRRQQFEMIKEKVRGNIELEEQKRLEDFLVRKERKDQQEAKIRLSKIMQIEDIRRRAEERNMKIQQTIAESQKQVEVKKDKILRKQWAAEQRLEEQRLKQQEEEEKRKELFLVKNELKKFNAERKKRKDQYKIEKVKERLEFDDMRRVAFATQKDEFKSLRVKNQVEAQMQRQLIRTALYHMAVWNVWDMDVVQQIISDPTCTASKTVEDLIRQKASFVQREKRYSSAMSRRITGGLYNNIIGYHSELGSRENSQQNLTTRSVGIGNLRNSLGGIDDTATGTTRYFSTNKGNAGTSGVKAAEGKPKVVEEKKEEESAKKPVQIEKTSPKENVEDKKEDEEDIEAEYFAAENEMVKEGESPQQNPSEYTTYQPISYFHSLLLNNHYLFPYNAIHSVNGTAITV